ncbi:peptide chain release factor aRF-1 [Candidatus Woesearchaeota archaeon]|nr:peptide chain release factor aRF-1 [Candidatus Woesearchaeota archaeon]
MDEASAAERFQLKRFIKDLSRYRGRHTELVSVYVPTGYELVKIIQHLSQEQGTASNIKDATTRKNVVDALERMVQHLRLFKQTPPKGLAVFSGNVSEREGGQDIKVWSLEPPIPLNTRLYRCDKTFVLDLLEQMLETKSIYGLIVMDRREGNLALLKGRQLIPLVKKKSNVPGKHRAGGQSAHRFEQLRENAAKDFYNRLGELVKEQFFGKPEIKGILVGGPGPTKYTFIEGNFIPTEVKQKIIAVRDLSYTGEFGLEELLDKSQDALANEEVGREKALMNRFFKFLATQMGMVSYGKDAVMRLLKLGAVETLLLSEALDDATLEEFEEEAKKMGTTVELISTETREGVQLRDLGKIGAILRYETR